MRKITFNINGKDYEGFYIGISSGGIDKQGNNYTLLLVEDTEGNAYTVYDNSVKFKDKPVCMAPVKRIDFKLMRNALEGMEGNFTLTNLINLAEEKKYYH